MIYTLTINPSIDYHMFLGDRALRTGEINRSQREVFYPGGKGINVSVLLARLGIENCALGFTAGRIGELLRRLVEEEGCRSDFIQLSEGETRINVKLDGAAETAVNGNGPHIDRQKIEQLMERLSSLEPGDFLIVSGNLQSDIADTYKRIAETARRRGAHLIVDTTGAALSQTFPYAPFLIKPNVQELGELFGTEASGIGQVTEMMRKVQKQGVQNVLVSLGEKGALLLTAENKIYRAKVLNRRQPGSTVGAGDSMIAGFVASYREDPSDMERALKMAAAAGTATVYASWLAGAQEVYKAAGDIQVCRIEKR